MRDGTVICSTPSKEMILVINAGSSNVKFAIYDESLTLKFRSQVSTIQEVYLWLSGNKQQFKITAVGHRVVHGGNKFFLPVVVTKEIIKQLKTLIPLAPLHQPHNIAAIEELMQLYPDLKQIACFDTAFHRTQIELAKQIAIPQELTDEGVQRYGFHGLSYEYIASVMQEQFGDKETNKVIVAHLGNGSSMCAMNDKKSVATSMGFSALDGLMMGTRCGSIDPGVLLYLLQEKKFKPDELSEFLYSHCGLLGVSGVSNDMRVLLDEQSERAKLAVDLYCYRAACEFGKLIVSLNGCDLLLFTAGIGENSPEVRSGICKWLAWLGIEIDQAANSGNKQIVSAVSSKIKVGMLHTDEELIIAQHVINLLR